MKLADRIGFTLAAGLLSVYDVIPPEGKPTPSPDDFVYEDNFARYVIRDVGRDLWLIRCRQVPIRIGLLFPSTAP